MQAAGSRAGDTVIDVTPPPSPKAVIQALKRAAGGVAGIPPPEIVGVALRKTGVPITDENIVQALVEAAGPAAKPPWAPSLEDIAKVREAGDSEDDSVLGQLDLPPAEPQMTPALREELSSVMGGGKEGSASPRGVVKALMMVAGTDAGSPPPEVVGTALRASGVEATRENVVEALLEAGLENPPEEAVQAAMAAAAAGPRAAAARPTAARDPADRRQGGGAAPSPEEVILRLQAAQATVDDSTAPPPPEVVGVALHIAGVPTTRDNVVRALQQASGQPPSGEEVRVALMAIAEEIANPGAIRGAQSGDAAAPLGGMPQQAPQAPEDVVQLLLRAAGPGAVAPPAEVIGMALRSAGVDVTKENVIRAFSEVARQGAQPPTLGEVDVAVAAGAANSGS